MDACEGLGGWNRGEPSSRAANTQITSNVSPSAQPTNFVSLLFYEGRRRAQTADAEMAARGD